MYWGHAVSKDLLHWEHLPIALTPDDLGVIFSGGGVLDVDNTSGFGGRKRDSSNPPMVVAYTSHNQMMRTEQQSIAFSTDYIHFEKYEGNPVIAGIPGKNMRDPKLFWNPVRQCWGMVLTAEGCVDFYCSSNLRQWKKTGTFAAGRHGLRGICECPDLFPFRTPEGEKWVLIVSMVLPEADLRMATSFANRTSHITQYYVGDFDGDVFTDTECADEALLIDYGSDNYAAVSFYGCDERILMGWADNWDYANISPPAREGFQGKMTLPRKAELNRTSHGWRLVQTFAGLESYRKDSELITCGEHQLNSCTFGLSVKGTGTIALENDEGERLIVLLGEDEYVIDRRKAGENSFSDIFASDRCSDIHILRENRTDDTAELVFDHSILEMIADGGQKTAAVNVYPRYNYERLVCSQGLECRIWYIS